MVDQSVRKNASDNEQKFYASRNSVEHSSDSVSNDTVRKEPKQDVRTIEQPYSKPTKSTIRRVLDWFSKGNGRNMKADVPGVPYVTSLDSDRVDIAWEHVTSFCHGDVYEVRIKHIQQKQRNFQIFQTCSGTVENLEPGTAYIFKVRMIKADGKEGIFSEYSEQVITLDEVKREVNQPGSPVVKHVSSNSVDIEWDPVDNFCPGDGYQVLIKNTLNDKWASHTFPINSCRLSGLEPGTPYIVYVQLIKVVNGMKCKSSKKSRSFMTKGTPNVAVDRPGKPLLKNVSSDSVVIEWDAAKSFSIGDVYQVRFENTKQREWYFQNFETNSGKIVGLQQGTTYIFKVRLVKTDGEECKYGETSDEVTTKEVAIPGKPLVQNVSTDSVGIIWERVDNFCEGDMYKVHVININENTEIEMPFDKNNGIIGGLQPNSRYVFKVRLVKRNREESKCSDNSDVVTTLPTFASKVIQFSRQVETSCKGTSLYELPLVELPGARNGSGRATKYELGPKGKGDIVERTIMLVGATGTGKSTFVDSLANYVLGVRMEDNYRFTVTKKEDREKQKDQAQSQTDWITSYTLNPQEGTRLTYRLHVIDTPGFGDTRGRKRDKVIIEQISKLFKERGETGFQTINAICFFVKASDGRLTDSQSYIFNEVQLLFGKDIKENICLLVTFAYGSDPPVMDAVRKFGLHYGDMFTFNNLSWSTDQKAQASSIFWEMGLVSFTALFNHIQTLEAKSLQLSSEVLQERQRLEETCQNLQIQINAGISVMKSIKKESEIIKQNMDQIRRNKNFTYTVSETKVISVDLPSGQRATNCLTCKTTCHRNCSDVFEKFPRMCWVMNWRNGHCNQCPQRCHWTSHKTTGYRFDTCEELVSKTFDDMQKRFRDATAKLLTVNEILDKMRGQQEDNKSKIKKMLQDILQCKNRLKEIALSQDTISMSEQIELLIKTEREEGKQGFQDRIEVLKQLLREY